MKRINTNEMELFDDMTNEYGVVKNCEATYKFLGWGFPDRRSMIIHWTPDEESVFDLLFTIPSLQTGRLQGGLSIDRYLYVSIMRIGAFGFKVDNPERLHWKYVREKLSEDKLGENEAKELTKLIIGICLNFDEMMGEKKYRD